MLGEFFAARRDEVDDGLVEHGPFERFATVEAKTFTEVSLATLGEILEVAPYPALVDRIADAPQIESGEAGLLWLPTEFRDALATLQEERSVAERWVATDELAADGWEAGEAATVLGELADLARRARAEEREVWYWWSI